jgi:hypothetical protein
MICSLMKNCFEEPGWRGSGGYVIKKSRQVISIDNCGDLTLVDLRTNAAILDSRYDATPEDVLEFFDRE